MRETLAERQHIHLESPSYHKAKRCWKAINLTNAPKHWAIVRRANFGLWIAEKKSKLL
jgi:hypothetical protein